MNRSRVRIPKYRHHKSTGRAVVTFNGRDIYLGRYDSPESHERYQRLVTLYLSGGGKLPTHCDGEGQAQESVTVTQVIAGFWRHAKIYYRRPDGTPTTEQDNLRQVLRLLKQQYGSAPASKFGPLALKTLRQAMIQKGWCRTHINKQVNRVKLVFRWAVSEELVSPAVVQALSTVAALRAGRSEACEKGPVKPVPEDLIAPINPFVCAPVWAMIQLQLLTGARAGELITLRAIDLNTTGEVWTFSPDEHKTAHHGKFRTIFFGPKAQAVLQPFLASRPIGAGAYLFCPADAEAERRSALHAGRHTPGSCGNRPGSNRRSAPRRSAGEHYTVASYRRAIARACDQAFPPPENLRRRRVPAKGRKKYATRWETPAEWEERLGPVLWEDLRTWQRDHRWHPHQLRHNAATELRKAFGIEAARTILGHSSASMTEHYAERDMAKAAKIISRVG